MSTKCNNDKSSCNFFFDALGDLTYSQEDYDAVVILINKVINKEKPAFVIHIGDTQPSPRGLSRPGITWLPIALNEEQFIAKRNLWWTIKSPFFITPGDNDWTDTIEAPSPNIIMPWTPPYPPNPDPISTLEAFRTVFYRQGMNKQPRFQVCTQRNFIENKRWIYRDVIFMTVHTVSGNNGLNPNNSPFPEARQAIIDESQIRINANLDWINRAFDLAEELQLRGLVIATQAAFDFFNPSSGFSAMIKLIRDRTLYNYNLKNSMQVLFIYGDAHEFKVSKPLPISGTYPPLEVLRPDANALPNFTAICVPGAAYKENTFIGFPGRVKISVDFNSQGLFSVYTSLNTL